MHVCPECGHSAEVPGWCPADGVALSETADALLGSQIDRYRLARLLGEGGMGRVYLAVQPAIGSRVAIKLLSEECARSAELLDRFFAEARAVNLIRHEHIVGVLDLARLPDGRPYIVMEFIPGQTLSSLVRGGGAPLGGVVQVMSEILSALAAAHAIGIVHRDLKPDNVLVTGEGHAKVLDFGIAKLAPGLREGVSPRTRTGALLGTPAYMAPEQITGSGNVDARADIYSAGVVLFEAVTGQQPFSGGTMFDLMRAHLEQAPPSPRSLRPDLPAGLETVILQALAKKPEDRFASALAMANAMNAAAQAIPADQWVTLSTRTGVGGPRVTTPRHSAPPTERERGGQHRSTAIAGTERSKGKSKAGYAVLAIVLLAIVGGVIALTRGSAGGSEPATATPAPTQVAKAVEPAPVTPVAPVETKSGSPSPTPTPTQPTLPTLPSKTPPTMPTMPAPPTMPAHTPAPKSPTPTPDPSVVIGKNVTIGNNVFINGQPATPTAPVAPPPSKNTANLPADYDAKHFDPVANLGKAEALARTLLPDAQLTSFEFDPVFPDGHVDLTMDGRDREYDFRSPEHSKHPTDVPRNVPVELACRVHVEVGVHEMSARIVSSDSCDKKLIHHPRCRLASVWQQALSNGTPRDVVARIAWLSDEQWFFDIDLAGNGGGVSTFADRCP